MIESVPSAGKIMPNGLGVVVGGEIGIVFKQFGGLDSGAVAKSLSQGVEERLVLPHCTAMEEDEGIAINNGAVGREKKAVGHGLAETLGRGAKAIGSNGHLKIDELIAVGNQIDKAVGKTVVGRMKAQPLEHLTEGGEGINNDCGTFVRIEAVVLVGKGVVGVVGRVVAAGSAGASSLPLQAKRDATTKSRIISLRKIIWPTT